MCTAASFNTKDFYFGRTLDYEFSYGEEITITPRNYILNFRKEEHLKNHYAIIGMAHVLNDYPLYYDGINEKGLGMAGLNFKGNAVYQTVTEGKSNIAVFEFIPWILGKCQSTDEAVKEIENMNLVDIPFGEKMPSAQLHYIIADKNRTVTVECMADEIHIYENKAGVLTNNPPFNIQEFLLNNYMNLSPKQPKNIFSDKLDLKCYSRGMGAMGLPGDLSSSSRFVRVAFTKLNSVIPETEEESVSQFFHILGSVEQQKGCCEVENGFEYTIYTSCCNGDKGIYYYTTYNNSQITAVDMHKTDLNDSRLKRYPIVLQGKINWQN